LLLQIFLVAEIHQVEQVGHRYYLLDAQEETHQFYARISVVFKGAGNFLLIYSVQVDVFVHELGYTCLVYAW
jgi:hypothetical protein